MAPLRLMPATASLSTLLTPGKPAKGCCAGYRRPHARQALAHPSAQRQVVIADIIPPHVAHLQGRCLPWRPACPHHLHPWALPLGQAGAAYWERSSPGCRTGRDFVHCGGCPRRRPAPRGARPRGPGHGDGAPAHFDLRGARAGRPLLLQGGDCCGQQGCGCACAPCQYPAPGLCLNARAAYMPEHKVSNCRAEHDGV